VLEVTTHLNILISPFSQPTQVFAIMTTLPELRALVVWMTRGHILLLVTVEAIQRGADVI